MTQECLNPSPLLYSLPDSSLTASSIGGNAEGHFPPMSRLFNLLGYASWASFVNEIGEYIQAHLFQPFIVQGFSTRGRGDGYERYLRAYKFGTSMNSSTFDIIRLRNGEEKVFAGNVNTTGIVRHTIDAVEGQFVRLIAVAWEYHITVRWEIYACLSSCKCHILITIKSRPLVGGC